MKCYIKYLGVVDKYNNCHHIDFQEGLNIITGRSSTGKSAIIEIFDYCVGNSENTVPVGVITENADIYFVVLVANDMPLVIGRKQEGGARRAFYKIESSSFDINELQIDYFQEEYFITLVDFKDELGRFCGLNITDTDENTEDIKYRGKKKGRPSIRNMVSFILQHQNLIANKHTIFYRFDQKEKQEHVIDEFKIFAGFVDQQYYVLCQQLNEKKKKVDDYNVMSSRIEAEKAERVSVLDELRESYYNVSGKELFPGVESQHILNTPQQYVDELEKIEVSVIDDSDEYRKNYNQLMQQKNELIAKRRKAHLELQQIKSSIQYATQYAKEMDKFHPISEAIKGESECPFCHHKNDSTKDEYNKLFDAINWLNDELKKSPQRVASFLPRKKEVEDSITSLNEQIENIDKELSKILKINNLLLKNKSLDEQSLKIKLQLENELEWVITKKKNLSQSNNIEVLNKEIQVLEKFLRDKYDVEKKQQEAEKFINNAMNEIGNQLDFEQSYKPINLHFDIKTFDLYHQKSNNERVYLRSMGSGANWLYSHICLFLAFQKFFASIDNSTVPNILFLDQPSQVYFPSVLDFGGDFDYKALKKSENKENEADDDLQSVTRLYDIIIEVIESINNEYGFKPQIIVSDHADNLPLTKGHFESYVRKRWRKENEGFIDMSLIGNYTTNNENLL